MLALIRKLRDWAWDVQEEPLSDDTSPEGTVTSSASATEWAEVWRDASCGIPRSAEAQRLVRRGVPPLMRAEVWRRCADTVNFPHQMMQQTPGYYAALLERASTEVGRPHLSIFGRHLEKSAS